MKKKGFSLIELLVAVSIVAILSTLISFIVFGSQERSRDGKRKADLQAIAGALATYHLDMKAYPKSAAISGAGTVAGVSASVTGGETPRASGVIDADEICTPFFGRTGAEFCTKDYLVTIPTDPINDSGRGYVYGYKGDGTQFKLWAKSERLQGLETDRQKNLADKYYNPVSNEGDLFQVSSSETATLWRFGSGQISPTPTDPVEGEN